MLASKGVALYNCCNLGGVRIMAQEKRETDGYHLLYMARNHQAWICPERVGRRQPNDPLDFASANHFVTRAAANDYINRRGWKSDLRRRVEECTWSSTKKDKNGEKVRVVGVCLRAHLPEFLAVQAPAEVADWDQARRSLATAKSARQRERTAQRKAAFQDAVDAEVARRLAELGVA